MLCTMPLMALCHFFTGSSDCIRNTTHARCASRASCSTSTVPASCTHMSHACALYILGRDVSRCTCARTACAWRRQRHLFSDLCWPARGPMLRAAFLGRRRICVVRLCLMTGRTFCDIHGPNITQALAQARPQMYGPSPTQQRIVKAQAQHNCATSSTT
jgi:hypothetical protein